MLNLIRLEQNEGNVCGRLLVLVIEAENLQQASTGKNACALYNIAMQTTPVSIHLFHPAWIFLPILMLFRISSNVLIFSSGYYR